MRPAVASSAAMPWSTITRATCVGVSASDKPGRDPLQSRQTIERTFGKLAGAALRGEPYELLVGQLALGDVGVDLKDGHGLAAGIALNSLAARDDDLAAVPARVHKLAFPVALSHQRPIDGSQRNREPRLEQRMGDLIVSLLTRPAVQTLRAAIPVRDRAGAHVADQDRVLGQLEELGLASGVDGAAV